MTSQPALPPGSPDSELYYYTDSHGLYGILTPAPWPACTVSGRPDALEDPRYAYELAAHLKASDVRYMNDASELVFGAKPIAERLDDASTRRDIEAPIRDALRTVAQTMTEKPPHEWPWQIFAACFCEDGDLLSQWRGYAGGLGGYSIGFTPAALTQYSYAIPGTIDGAPPATARPVTLHKVGYGEAAAERCADALLEQLVWLLGMDGPPQYADPDVDYSDAAFLLEHTVGLNAFRAAATVKHGAFAAESEWRLIAQHERQYLTRVRPRAVGLVPYVDLVVNARLSVAGPETVAQRAVSNIVVGPAKDQPSQVAAVKMLLHSRGQDWLDGVLVRPSSTPFLG